VSQHVFRKRFFRKGCVAYPTARNDMGFLIDRAWGRDVRAPVMRRGGLSFSEVVPRWWLGSGMGASALDEGSLPRQPNVHRKGNRFRREFLGTAF